MSLILEALKKSEQQRRLGEAPTLGSPVVATRRRRNLLPVFAILIVIAAAAGWWLTRPTPPPASQPATSDSAKPIAAQPANRPANPAARTPNPARGGAAPIAKDRVKPGTLLGEQNRTRADKADIEKRAAASAMQPATAPSKTTAATLPKPTAPTPAGAKPLATAPAPPKPVDAGKTPAPSADTAAAPAAKAAPPDADRIATDKIATDQDKIATRTPAAPPAAPAAAGEQIPSIWELPYATRKDIPAIDLTMHVYSSDPAQRFAVIKGARHAEGDEIGEDLVLREIRPDGLVLEYKGQRFLFPRNGR